MRTTIMRIDAHNGLRRTNADKRKAVETYIRIKPEASDRSIAEWCGVSNPLVGGIRRELLTVSSSANPPTRIGADGKERRVPEKAAKAERQPGEDEELGNSFDTDSTPISDDESPTSTEPNRGFRAINAGCGNHAATKRRRKIASDSPLQFWRAKRTLRSDPTKCLEPLRRV